MATSSAIGASANSAGNHSDTDAIDEEDDELVNEHVIRSFAFLKNLLRLHDAFILQSYIIILDYIIPMKLNMELFSNQFWRQFSFFFNFS